MLRKSMVVGFPIPYFLLWMISFFAGILSGVGTAVATIVSDFLSSKQMVKGIKTEIIGFIAAALVNCFIVVMILVYFGEVKLHPQTVMVLMIGLAMRGVYGLYIYRLVNVLGEFTFGLKFIFFSSLTFIYTHIASASPFMDNIEGLVYFKREYLKKKFFLKFQI